MIRDNLYAINENINKAAQKSGRKAEDITLIAVTKTVSQERIAELLSFGVTILGENKVQELLSKYGTFSPEPTWHMIGHLQTNKVKSIIDKVKMIQSVDSIKLVSEINRYAKQIDRVMDILIELNIADEDSKYGIKPPELNSFLEHLDGFANICVKGLMCIAPFVKNPEDNRVFYAKMHQKFLDSKMLNFHNMSMEYLSMGMTIDYPIAIEEGANMVRIGTALFGARV